jgi:hypothetical protein
MALNTYLHLELNGSPVTGGVTQKGREGTIEVTSLEWTYDSDGIGEIRFTAGADRETVPIENGLKTNASVDALFDFWTPTLSGTGGTGTETLYMTLHGTNGSIKAVSMWMLNNKDPNLTRYETTIQYVMAFQANPHDWLPSPAQSVSLP